MKRLFLTAGIAVTIGFFSSCAQHDTNSPDTAGSEPYNKPGVGVDTSGVRSGAGGAAPNHSNDGINNNQQVNTGDSSNKR